MPENSPEEPGQIDLTLEVTDFTVLPGGRVSIPMQLKNLGNDEGFYQLSLVGLPAAWVSTLFPVVHLGPGEQQEVVLVVSPPPIPQSRVGRYPIALLAVNQLNPDHKVEVSATLTIAAFEVKGRISLLMESTQYAVTPGESVSLELVLVNTGLVEDYLNLSVEGIPTGWVSTASPVSHLPAGEEKQVILTIRPPRFPQSLAGRRTFKVRVTSRVDPNNPIEAVCRLIIGVFNDFECDLHPETIQTGQYGMLTVHNRGNAQDVYRINWESQSSSLSFEAAQPAPTHARAGGYGLESERVFAPVSVQELRIPAGGSSAVEFRAKPVRPLWIGGQVVYPFTVRVQSTSRSFRHFNGELVARGLLPVWVLPVLLVLSLCILCAMVIGFYWQSSRQEGNATRTAALTETAALSQVLSATQTAAALIGQQDSDGDGLSNQEEAERGTNSNNPDTDGDSLLDGEEVRARGTNPLNPDTDGDGLNDGEEVRRGTDPLKPDTDADLLKDSDEVRLGTDPLKPDTDADGLLDGDEVQRKTDPRNPDTDGDTWRDGDEVSIGTSPLNPDTDGDRLADGRESAARACPDPLNPDSDSDGVVDGADLDPCNKTNPLLTASVILPPTVTQPPPTAPQLTPTPTTTPQLTPDLPSLEGVIAFESNREGNSEIYSFRTVGFITTRLTISPGIDTQPALSPNGAQIVFTSNRDGNNEIYLMNADGTGLVNLTRHPADDQYPVWSPNGSLIAFTTNRDGNQEIYTMRTDGTELRNLTNSSSNDYQPTWFSQKSLFVTIGEWIAFTSERDGNQEIYLMDEDGSDQKNLTKNPANDFFPAGERDGGRIAFNSDRDGNLDIFIMDKDGGDVRNLTRNPAGDAQPAWSPDRDWLAFTTSRDGNLDIYIISVSGSQFYPIIVSPAEDRYPSWR